MSSITVLSPRHGNASGPSGPGGWSGPSPMDAVETAFGLLGCDPAPLSVNGARIGWGLPARPVPLPELRRYLLDPVTPFAARDAAWRLLVRKGRRDGPAWVVAAAGIALPGLRRLSHELAVSSGADSHDLDAEVLAGFVGALRTVDVRRGRIASRLCFAAYNAGRRLARREAAAAGLRVPLAESMMPARPSGHPDFVLARAVRLGVLTSDEADLIGRSRLEDVPVAKLAAERGISAAAAGMRRHRAETRLAAALAEGHLAEL
jgi:hypothetical protein